MTTEVWKADYWSEFQSPRTITLHKIIIVTELELVMIKLHQISNQYLQA